MEIFILVKRDSISDAMLILLQDAARRETGFLYPYRSFSDTTDVDKEVEKLYRRKMIKRTRVEPIQEHVGKTRGVGYYNYQITPAGYKAISWG